jgi:hypothetical protein
MFGDATQLEEVNQRPISHWLNSRSMRAFASLGLGSIDRTHVVVALERERGVEIEEMAAGPSTAGGKWRVRALPRLRSAHYVPCQFRETDQLDRR